MWLFGKWRPLRRQKPGAAIFSLKPAAGVKPARSLRLHRGSLRKRPLDSAAFFQCGISDAGVIAQASAGNPTPLVKGIGGTLPAGEKFISAAQPIRNRQKNIEVTSGFARWSDCGIDLAYAPFGVGVSTLLSRPRSLLATSYLPTRSSALDESHPAPRESPDCSGHV